MKVVRYIAVLFLLLDACVDPFQLTTIKQDALVVDGSITDQPGPQTVKISKVFGLDEQQNVIQWVTGAVVSIFDETGAEIKLKETSTGNYQTDSTIRGVVGKTYTLHFSTNDGDIYESVPEKLLAVGDIDSLYQEFEMNEPGNTLEYGNSLNGFNVKLNGKFLPEQGGLVRWRWVGIFGIRTYPEFRLKPGNGPGITWVPDPPSCSGYRVQRGTSALEYSGPCTCCYCWVTQYDDGVELSDERFITDNQVTAQPVTFVQANRRYMFDKYVLRVDQMSVSQAVYDFWKRVDKEQSTGSNLFQTPPSPSTGNIQVISGPIPALGIFSASAIKSKTITLDRYDVPYMVLPIDTVKTSCREAYQNSTTKRPPFW